VPSQWESQKFDPTLLPHFNRFFENSKPKKYIWNTTSQAKFG